MWGAAQAMRSVVTWFGDRTYCGDHTVKSINVESLSYAEASIVYADYTLIKIFLLVFPTNIQFYVKLKINLYV